MGTALTTPAEYAHICDGCGQTVDTDSPTPPEDWETWSRSAVGGAGAAVALLCPECGAKHAEAMYVPPLATLPTPPPPPA